MRESTLPPNFSWLMPGLLKEVIKIFWILTKYSQQSDPHPPSHKNTQTEIILISWDFFDDIFILCCLVAVGTVFSSSRFSINFITRLNIIDPFSSIYWVFCLYNLKCLVYLPLSSWTERMCMCSQTLEIKWTKGSFLKLQYCPHYLLPWCWFNFVRINRSEILN